MSGIALPAGGKHSGILPAFGASAMKSDCFHPCILGQLNPSKRGSPPPEPAASPSVSIHRTCHRPHTAASSCRCPPPVLPPASISPPLGLPRSADCCKSTRFRQTLTGAPCPPAQRGKSTASPHPPKCPSRSRKISAYGCCLRFGPA